MGQPVGVRLSPSAPISFRVPSQNAGDQLKRNIFPSQFPHYFSDYSGCHRQHHDWRQHAPQGHSSETLQASSQHIWDISHFFWSVSGCHSPPAGQFRIQLLCHGIFFNYHSSQPQVERDRACHYRFHRAGPAGWGRHLQHFITNISLPILRRMCCNEHMETQLYRKRVS
jgi:hypothetical protein